MRKLPDGAWTPGSWPRLLFQTSDPRALGAVRGADLRPQPRSGAREASAKASGGQRLRGGRACRLLGVKPFRASKPLPTPSTASATVTHVGGGFKETRKSLPPLAVRASARPSEAPPSGRGKGAQTKAPEWPCAPEKDEVPDSSARCVAAVGGGASPPILTDPCRPRFKPLPCPSWAVPQLPGATPGEGRSRISPHLCEVVFLNTGPTVQYAAIVVPSVMPSSYHSGEVSPLAPIALTSLHAPQPGPLLEQGRGRARHLSRAGRQAGEQPPLPTRQLLLVIGRKSLLTPLAKEPTATMGSGNRNGQ